MVSLLVVLFLGTTGFSVMERMKLPDALLSAVSVMTLADIPSGLSPMGKLFTVAIVLGTLTIIISGVYRKLNPQEGQDETLTNFFGSGSGQQDIIMKELKIDKRSQLAGRQKAQILEKHGLVVVGVKHKGGFDVDVPLKMKVNNGSSILVLGTPAAVLAAEKKSKAKNQP